LAVRTTFFVSAPLKLSWRRRAVFGNYRMFSFSVVDAITSNFVSVFVVNRYLRYRYPSRSKPTSSPRSFSSVGIWMCFYILHHIKRRSIEQL